MSRRSTDELPYPNAEGNESDWSRIVSRIAHQSCCNTPPMMPRQPWWDHLETNFSRRPEGFELSTSDQLQVVLTAALDTLIRTSGAVMVGATALPAGYHPLKIRRLLEDGDFYKSLVNGRNPKRFFAHPPRGLQVTASRPWFPSFRANHGTCEDLRFESPFTPVNPRHREAHMRHRRNRIAHARYWRHNRGPRPTIAAIHGFGADQYWVNAWFFGLKWFYRLGCDVLLVTLPFHGPRQARFSPFSGYGFFANGIAGINEALAQAVMDFRIFLNHLEEHYGVKKLGLTGVSLGGFTAALIAAVEPRLSFAVPNVPLASVADLILEWTPIGQIVRSMLLVMGRSIREIRHMLAVSTPLTYPPVIERERLMIIGGVGDRLAPPKHSRLLWDHWGRPRMHWYPGSHIIHLDRGAYLKQMATFMAEVGFLAHWDMSRLDDRTPRKS